MILREIYFSHPALLIKILLLPDFLLLSKREFDFLGQKHLFQNRLSSKACGRIIMHQIFWRRRKKRLTDQRFCMRCFWVKLLVRWVIWRAALNWRSVRKYQKVWLSKIIFIREIRWNMIKVRIFMNKKCKGISIARMVSKIKYPWASFRQHKRIEDWIRKNLPFGTNPFLLQEIIRILFSTRSSKKILVMAQLILQPIAA